MAEVETIIFNGIKFRRYPESRNWAERTYYRPGGEHIVRGIEALHREIWKAYHGPIPDGKVVHHKDGNSLNNEFENLELVASNSAHQDLHRVKSSEQLVELRASVAHARKFASAWHGSPEGRAWHSEHGKRIWEGRETTLLTCQHCGREYETLAPAHSKFCSSNCKSAARRASDVDNETRMCAACGREFTINRYMPTRTCSGSCAASLRYRDKQGRLQPSGGQLP